MYGTSYLKTQSNEKNRMFCGFLYLVEECVFSKVCEKEKNLLPDCVSILYIHQNTRPFSPIPLVFF
jgi:hypothetical protein